MNKVVTYDAATLSDAEIIAPQIDKTQPMLEIRALRQALKTAATTDAVKKVVGDRTVIKLGEAKNLLHAAAAVVAAERALKKGSKIVDSKQSDNRFMDADAINKLNANIYGA